MKFVKPKGNKPLKETKAIPLDVTTIEQVNRYAEDHGLSFAAVVRMATNDFFLRGGLK